MKQNMLTPESTAHLLDALKPVAVFSGHDHEGCFFLHEKSIPEYTVRSSMAEFSGNSAFFEIRRSPGAKGGFEYSYSDCIFLDHIWVKVVLISSAATQLISLLGLILARLCRTHKKKEKAQ